jgi:hypothetical protein
VPMPRPPNSDPERPALKCPTCGEVLTFHNDRTEHKGKAQRETIEVYFCRHMDFGASVRIRN